MAEILDRQELGIAKLCVFQAPGLEDYALALTIPEVLAVSAIPELQSVPFSPDFILGLTLWRDQLASVIDLAAALSGTRADVLNRHQSSRYLIGQTIWGGRREVFAWPILQGTETLSVSLRDVQLHNAAIFDSRLIYSVIYSGERKFILINTAGLAALRK